MQRYLVLFLLSFSPLFGDESFFEGQTYNYWGDFLNMLATLGFVIVLIFATVWVLKKIMRSRVQTLNRSNGIKVLERRPINPKASLYLIDILGKGIVISESQAGIHLIKEFPENVNLEELLEQLREEQKPRLSFKEMFTQKLKKPAPKHDG